MHSASSYLLCTYHNGEASVYFQSTVLWVAGFSPGESQTFRLALYSLQLSTRAVSAATGIKVLLPPVSSTVALKLLLV